MMQMLFDSLPIAPKPAASTNMPAPKSLPPLIIVIEGEPVAWQRSGERIAKTSQGKLYIHHYIQKETEQYQTRIRQHARRALSSLDYSIEKFYPVDDRPVGLLVRAFKSIPQSWSKKDKLAALRGEIFPLTKPDHDNYIKIVSDAFNGLIYRDDALVMDSHQIKRYSDQPRLEIEVYV